MGRKSALHLDNNDMNRDAVTDAFVVQTEAAPVSREAAEEAVRKLLLWSGDDPAREDLVDTPRRVANAYEEFFAGYHIDPAAFFGAHLRRNGRI